MRADESGSGYSDAEVVVGYLQRDTVVQRWWYARCRRQFAVGTSNYGGLSEYDREDLFQDSFIILWEKMVAHQIFELNGIVSVVSRRGEYVVPDLMGYFMRIVKNKYLEMLRSGKYLSSLNIAVSPSEEDIYDDLYWDENPEAEKDRIVSKCLLDLPKSCLEILTKFYYEKKSLDEILAERPENSSYAGLKSRKSKCMTNLKKRIAESFSKAGLR